MKKLFSILTAFLLIASLHANETKPATKKRPPVQKRGPASLSFDFSMDARPSPATFFVVVTEPNSKVHTKGPFTTNEATATTASITVPAKALQGVYTAAIYLDEIDQALPADAATITMKNSRNNTITEFTTPSTKNPKPGMTFAYDFIYSTKITP